MSDSFPGFPADAGHPCAADPTLRVEASRLLRNCIAPASWRAYNSGQAHYRGFCGRYGIPTTPASADTLVYYLAHLKRCGVAVSTAKQRLAAVRHLHIQRGLRFEVGRDPLVAAALKGFPRRGGAPARVPRRAITVNQLRSLKTSLGTEALSYFDQRCIWAALCVAYYGGLRASDYLGHGRHRVLRRSHARFAPDRGEFVIELRIQKNHQFGPPMHVHLPRTGTSTCPARALQLYCELRDQRAGDQEPLFLLDSGATLQRRQVSALLASLLGTGYSSHSLRVGLATEAAAVGIPDSTIQLLGRWRSTAYQGYIRGQRSELSGALRTIARSRRQPPAHGPVAPATSD